MSQLDLFGGGGDDLPPPDPQLVKLAERIPPGVRFGTSSWTFEGWKGIVYRKRYRTKQAFVRESLREYARFPLFGTVGVDRTFYNPFTEAEARAHAEQLPDGFPCCLKVWSEITTRVFADHPRNGERAGRANPSFLDPDLFREAVVRPLEAGFREHVGALVLVIAPGPGTAAAFESKLERFLARAPRAFPLAFELRDRALFTDRYLAMLRAHGGASHALSYWSRMPDVGAQLVRDVLMGDQVVCRLMIPPGRRYEDMKAAYAPFDRLHETRADMRRDVHRLLAEAKTRAMRSLVIVNNKVEGSSPLTVHGLVRELPEPPELGSGASVS